VEPVRAMYVQALLMAIAHPLAYSQSELDTLWQLAKGFCGLCALREQEHGADLACVPEDADLGPGQRLEEEAAPHWLDLGPFRLELSNALARERDGIADVVPGNSMGVPVAVEMLQRLQRAFGMAAARTHPRRLGGHMLQTVFGLSGLHFYLAGRRDFDTFVRQIAMHEHHSPDRASWAVAGAEGAKVAMIPARVLDQSLGGYRLSWQHAHQIRAKVGEMVGINLAEDGGDPDWMLGSIRWLRYEPGDSLVAGIDLLSRRTFPIGLRIADASGAAESAPVRALALEALAADDGIQYLTGGESWEAPGRVEIVRDDDDLTQDYLPDDDVVDIEQCVAMGDYRLLKPPRLEPAPDEAGEGETAQDEAVLDEAILDEAELDLADDAGVDADVEVDADMETDAVEAVEVEVAVLDYGSQAMFQEFLEIDVPSEQSTEPGLSFELIEPEDAEEPDADSDIAPPDEDAWNHGGEGLR
jgi:hypothetical protein